jgi:hypothetical protein
MHARECVSGLVHEANAHCDGCEAMHDILFVYMCCL